jgi:hypothetical protein
MAQEFGDRALIEQGVHFLICGFERVRDICAFEKDRVKASTQNSYDLTRVLTDWQEESSTRLLCFVR